MKNDIDNLKKMLIYRSQYRGTKEMDNLVGSFVKEYINKLNDIQLVELQKFLDLDDETLYKLYNNQLAEKDFINSNIQKIFKEFKYNK